jgi:hypothetical protein
MSVEDTLSYLLIWSFIGSITFSLYVIFVFRTGMVYITRNEKGLLKENIPLLGYLSSLGFLFCIIGFLVIANYFGLARKDFPIGFGVLFILNFALYLILFFYDTLVIDGLVLGYWRPSFLRLPEAMGKDSMKVHILKSLPVGFIFGLIISLVSTAISFFMLMR